MKKGCVSILSVLLASATVSMAQNALPYQESFEGYAVGSNLIGTVWHGNTTLNPVATVTNVSYTPPAGYTIAGSPIPGKGMVFSDGPITNEFDGTGKTIVALDTMIQPVFAERPDGDQMAGVSNSQVSLYVATNGLVNIWHGTGAGWGAPSGVQWSEFPQVTISSGSWVRATITMKYLYDLDSGSYVTMMKAEINGQTLTNNLGASTADPTSVGGGGAWFKAANWDAGAQLHRVVLSGSGHLDDMVVATNEVSFPPPEQYVTNGVPVSWMKNSGLNTNETNDTWDKVALDDQDLDGAPTWAEYIAGTNPNDGTSKLTIVSMSFSNGIPLLKWVGSSNAINPYIVQWTSNLMSISSWSTATNIPKFQNTNEFVIPTAPFSPAFLRVTVTN